MGSPLARWLSTLDADQLAEIIMRRPEAVAAPVRDLGALAARLQDRHAVIATLHTLPLPALQVVETLQLLGAPAVRQEDLAATLGRTPDDPDLAASLRMLAERALVWPDGPQLRMAGVLWAAFGHPLNLGEGVRALLDALPQDDLAAIAAELGAADQDRAGLLGAVRDRLCDAPAVRALAARAPAETRRLLERAAWDGPLVAPQVVVGGMRRRRPSGPARWAVERGLLIFDGWQLAQMPREVALALRGPDWHPPFTPRPPGLTARPVPDSDVERGAAAAASDTLAQVGAVVAACESVPAALLKSGGVGSRELRRLGRAAGCGEDVRLWLELAYAAGLLGTADSGVLPTAGYDQWLAAPPAERLAAVYAAWLQLPASVLPPEDSGVRGAALIGGGDPEAGQVRAYALRLLADLPAGHGAAGPAELAAAVRWQAPLLLSDLDEVTAAVSASWREAHLLGVLAHGVVTELGRALLDQDPGTLVKIAAELLPEPVTEALFQADLTAVVPGVPDHQLAALLDDAAVRESRGGASTWRFSAGSVRRALDAGHTRDGLLDALRSVAAGGRLPQPLEYLIGDAARRHGRLRVRAAGCVLHTADEALLIELTAARPLRELGLTRVAPTVLTSVRPPAATLAALRAAGYAPIGEDAAGNPVIERAERPRATPGTRSPRPVSDLPRAQEPDRPTVAQFGPGHRRQALVDPHELAVQLLAAAAEAPQEADPEDRAAVVAAVASAAATVEGSATAALAGADASSNVIPLRPGGRSGYRPAPPQPAGPATAGRNGRLPWSTDAGWTEDGDDLPAEEVDGLVQRYCAHLEAEEQALLAEAIGNGTPVRIAYTDSGGHASVRVIEPLDLDGHLLIAWCRLRDDERMFCLDRIDAVEPV